MVRGEGLQVGDRFPADRGMVGAALASGRPLLVPTAANDSRRDPVVDGPLGEGAVLCVPVLVDDVPAAVFCVGQKLGKGATFSREDREWPSAMGLRAGLAIEREQLTARAHQAQVQLTEANARLMESERIATFARTVFELSHQIDSPLSIIAAQTQLLAGRALAEGWEAADRLQESQEECQRISDLLSRMGEATDAMSARSPGSDD